MPVKNRIEERLTEALAPSVLIVSDQSHLHSGHAGARPGGETHFHVTVVAAAFEGKTQVERQRIVYGIIADELKKQVHAVSLKTLSPQENRDCCTTS